MWLDWRPTCTGATHASSRWARLGVVLCYIAYMLCYAGCVACANRTVLCSLTPLQVPTTLMAVVDAAVGIKTAVNFHEKKNKLGTYQPPLGVLYDTAFLHSLEARHISNGSAEVLKMACIKDQELFELLEEHGKDMIAQKFQVSIGARVLLSGWWRFG